MKIRDLGKNYWNFTMGDWNTEYSKILKDKVQQDLANKTLSFNPKNVYQEAKEAYTTVANTQNTRKALVAARYKKLAEKTGKSVLNLKLTSFGKGIKRSKGILGKIKFLGNSVGKKLPGIMNILYLIGELPMLKAAARNGDLPQQIGRSTLNIAGQAGGFALGTAAGGVLGAKVGALIGTAAGPLGTLVGGAIGLIVGGIGGCLGGKLAKTIGDGVFGKSIEEKKNEQGQLLAQQTIPQLNQQFNNPRISNNNQLYRTNPRLYNNLYLNGLDETNRILLETNNFCNYVDRLCYMQNLNTKNSKPQNNLQVMA